MSEVDDGGMALEIELLIPHYILLLCDSTAPDTEKHVEQMSGGKKWHQLTFIDATKAKQGHDAGRGGWAIAATGGAALLVQALISTAN